MPDASKPATPKPTTSTPAHREFCSTNKPGDFKYRACAPFCKAERAAAASNDRGHQSGGQRQRLGGESVGVHAQK